MLKVEGLSAGYGGGTVLEDVSLTVGEGEFVALVGSNNAGKTTLVNALTGIVPVRSGTKHWCGEDVTRSSTRDLVRRGVVQVPEGHQLFPEMTVAENLMVGGALSGRTERKEATDRVLGLFPRLSERTRQAAGTLSGGEQQMLAIACGLMAGPRLLILDEPSLGLAPKIVQTVFAALAELHRQGLAILVIEQNLKISLAHAERGYVLERGRVVFDADSESLARDDRVTAAYLGIS
ncbi:ABC transporter ATP-binding protein [Streptomyces mutabilis]|uniref:ABC transporter ATP-binding protein n=1 Tax=Streptomyces mutabilis TaxID=67332 RepID=UPI0033B39E8A